MKTQTQVEKRQLTIPSFDKEPLFVEIWQNSPKPKKSFVFIHGMTGDTVAYYQLMELVLAKIPEVQCVSYDLRGHGHSSRVFPEDNSLVAVFARDLRAVIGQLRLKNPIIVGQSMVAMLMQEYLFQKGPEFTAIVLVTPVVSLPSLFGSRTKWYQKLARFSQTNAVRRKRTLHDHMRFKGSFDYSLFRIISDVYFTGMWQYFLLWFSLFGWSGELTLLDKENVYYVYGEQDRIALPPLQRRTIKSLSRVQPKAIASNHNAIVNAPEYIVPFLEKIIAAETKRM